MLVQTGDRHIHRGEPVVVPVQISLDGVRYQPGIERRESEIALESVRSIGLVCEPPVALAGKRTGTMPGEIAPGDIGDIETLDPEFISKLDHIGQAGSRSGHMREEILSSFVEHEPLGTLENDMVRYPGRTGDGHPA